MSSARLDAARFLDDIGTGLPEAGPGNRIGTIDSGYTSGRPRVLFDGETVLGAKTYPFLASYAPRPGDRVALAPMGRSFVIVGAIDPATTAAPTYTNTSAAGTQLLTKRGGMVVLVFQLSATAAIAAQGAALTLPVGYRPDPTLANIAFGGLMAAGGTNSVQAFQVSTSDAVVRPWLAVPSGAVIAGTVTFPAGA